MSKHLLRLRFQKYDKYDNPIFIASSPKANSNQAGESENFQILKEYAEKLEEKDYGTYLPIYHSNLYNYATIRFKKNTKTQKDLIPNARYNVDYRIKTVAKDSKIYVNCILEKIKMVEQAPAVEDGEDLDL